MEYHRREGVSSFQSLGYSVLVNLVCMWLLHAPFCFQFSLIALFLTLNFHLRIHLNPCMHPESPIPISFLGTRFSLCLSLMQQMDNMFGFETIIN